MNNGFKVFFANISPKDNLIYSSGYKEAINYFELEQPSNDKMKEWSSDTGNQSDDKVDLSSIYYLRKINR